MRAVAAGVALMLSLAPAWAGQEKTPDHHWLVDTGLDLWPTGVSQWTSALYAPAGLDADGLVLKAGIVSALYRYDSWLFGRVNASKLAGGVLAGWRGHLGPIHVTLLSGPFVWNVATAPYDPFEATPGWRVAAFSTADLWWDGDWAGQKMMASVSGHLIEPGALYWTRLRSGVRLFETAWIGPELVVMGQWNGARALRLGLHVSEWELGRWRLGFSGGMTEAAFRTRTPYATLNLSWRY
jgi:hypothetical protein